MSISLHSPRVCAARVKIKRRLRCAGIPVPNGMFDIRFFAHMLVAVRFKSKMDRLYEGIIQRDLRGRRAYREGYDACTFGQWPNACPYPENAADPIEHNRWMEGWKQSQRDEQPATD